MATTSFAMVVIILGWGVPPADGTGSTGNAIGMLPGFTSQALCLEAVKQAKATPKQQTIHAYCTKHTE